MVCSRFQLHFEAYARKKGRKTEYWLLVKWIRMIAFILVTHGLDMQTKYNIRPSSRANLINHRPSKNSRVLPSRGRTEFGEKSADSKYFDRCTSVRDLVHRLFMAARDGRVLDSAPKFLSTCTRASPSCNFDERRREYSLSRLYGRLSARRNLSQPKTTARRFW